jgi:hypothetical protein
MEGSCGSSFLHEASDIINTKATAAQKSRFIISAFPFADPFNKKLIFPSALSSQVWKC